jgi:hypothetical protein
MLHKTTLFPSVFNASYKNCESNFYSRGARATLNFYHVFSLFTLRHVATKKDHDITVKIDREKPTPDKY